MIKIEPTNLQPFKVSNMLNSACWRPGKTLKYKCCVVAMQWLETALYVQVVALVAYNSAFLTEWLCLFTHTGFIDSSTLQVSESGTVNLPCWKENWDWIKESQSCWPWSTRDWIGRSRRYARPQSSNRRVDASCLQGWASGRGGLGKRQGKGVSRCWLPTPQ